MYQEPYYGCGNGCANCPRRAACTAAPSQSPAAADAAPAADGSLDAFLRANPDTGTVRIQAFRGNQAIPVENVRITVSRRIGDQDHTFFVGTTDASGILDPIALPAPSRALSQAPGDPRPYAVYDLRAEHPLFAPLVTTVEVFQNVKTVQPVQLRLKMG